MSEPVSPRSTDISRGVAELRAAMDALQTSLENLDSELYSGLDQWSPEALAARDSAIREWAETATHMQATLAALETRGAPAASAASA